MRRDPGIPADERQRQQNATPAQPPKPAPAKAPAINAVLAIDRAAEQRAPGYAARLLTREDVRVLTEDVKTNNPSAVEELTPALMSLGEIQRGEVADALAAATIESANDGHDGEALQNAALRLLVAG